MIAIFYVFFFWKHNYFTKFCQHLLLKCCYISKNNNFVATVCLPHNFWKKSGQMNRINAMDKSNSLSYGYIRKNSNEFEDIFTPPPRNFLDGRQPAGRGTKVYRLLLSIYVVSHVDYWGSRNILNCFFFSLKVRQNAKSGTFYPPNSTYWGKYLKCIINHQSIKMFTYE